MGINQRQRAAKIKKQQKKRRNMIIGGVLLSIAATMGLISSCDEKDIRKKPAHSSTEQRNKANLNKLAWTYTWSGKMLEKPTNLDELYKYSPTYRGIVKASRKSTIQYGGLLDKFLRNPSYENFNLNLLSALAANQTKFYRRVIGVEKELRIKQNGIQSILAELRNSKDVPDDELYTKILDMSYFLTRSTYNSRGIDVFSKNFSDNMTNGEGDCLTNSLSFIGNIYGLSEFSNRRYLGKDVRLVEGIDRNSQTTRKSHVWAEVKKEERWRTLECNLKEETQLLGQKYDSNERYHERALVPAHAERAFVGLVGLVNHMRGRELIITQEIYILPAGIEQEMKENGWRN